METKTYSTIDKSKWPDGPWKNEPDKIQWQDPETGLACLIVRNMSLCGYVGVAEGHPLFGKSYDEPDVRVHGGLTFADKCQPTETEAHGICHVPAPGEPDLVWWFGFDTGHGGDKIPHVSDGYYGRYGTYKDIEYVKAEVTQLAKQLKELEQN